VVFYLLQYICFPCKKIYIENEKKMMGLRSPENCFYVLFDLFTWGNFYERSIYFYLYRRRWSNEQNTVMYIRMYVCVYVCVFVCV